MKNKRRTVWAVSPKAPVLFLALLLVPCFTIFAQQDAKKFAAGLGPEWNMNSGENFALGFIFGADYNLPIEAAPFAAGLNFGVNINSGGVALEPAAMFRWYFLGRRHTKFYEETEGSSFKGSFRPAYDGFFVQADLGVTIILENDDAAARFLGGARAGYRIPLKWNLYVEPYGRFGYPFMFGFGALAGMKF